MQIAWGLLLPLLVFGALTAGAIAVMRYELKTGKALRFFVPFEPWSRDRKPTLFKFRQGMNLLFIVFVAAGTLAFLVQFLGIIHA